MVEVMDTVDLLQFLLDSSLKGVGHGYIINPALKQFRASGLPYCSRKIVLNSIYEICNSLGKFHIDLQAKIVKDFVDKYPVEDDPLKRLADSGSIMHHLIQSLLVTIGDYEVHHEDAIFFKEEGFRFYGHVDVQIFDHSSKILHVIDIKTVDSFSYRDFKNEPDAHHVDQLNVYLHYLRDKYPDWTIRPSIWYVLRSTDLSNDVLLVHILKKENWRVFYVDYNPQIIEKLVKKASTIYSQIMVNQLPPKFVQGDAEYWQCKNSRFNCLFFDFCHDFLVTTLDEVIAVIQFFETGEMGDLTAS